MVAVSTPTKSQICIELELAQQVADKASIVISDAVISDNGLKIIINNILTKEKQVIETNILYLDRIMELTKNILSSYSKDNSIIQRELTISDKNPIARFFGGAVRYNIFAPNGSKLTEYVKENYPNYNVKIRG